MNGAPLAGGLPYGRWACVGSTYIFTCGSYTIQVRTLRAALEDETWIFAHISKALSHRLVAVVWVRGILIYTWYLHLQRSFPIERLAAQHRYRKIALTAKDEARCLVCPDEEES